MYIQEAEAVNFRNYRFFSLNAFSKINILMGDNGQGKSSFLEALYCALSGKSFYSFVKSEFIQSGKEKTRIRLTLKESKNFSHVEARFFLYDKLKKDFFYCGKKIFSSDLEKKFPCFVFTEDHMKCLRKGAEERRSFVDEMLKGGESRGAKEGFNKILKTKRALLKKIQKGI